MSTESSLDLDLDLLKAESADANDLEELLLLEKKYLSRGNGFLASSLKSLPNNDVAAKKILGTQLNHFRQNVISIVGEYRKLKLQALLEQRVSEESIDLALPAYSSRSSICRIHPLTKARTLIENILVELGFGIYLGADIEDDLHNFTLINTPKIHPARQMHDTVYLKKQNIEPYGDYFSSNELLLRTQTSAQQIRVSKNLLLSQPSDSNSYKFATLGRTYRNDSDATHSPMFHQVEIVSISPKITSSDLFDLIKIFLQRFFSKNAVIKTKLRSSYFPFTQPSWEVDIFLESANKWLEVLGCGLIHPTVMQNMGFCPSKFKGFAIGMGIERLVMLKHELDDLRGFFSPNLEKHSGFYQRSESL